MPMVLQAVTGGKEAKPDQNIGAGVINPGGGGIKEKPHTYVINGGQGNKHHPQP